MILARKLGRYHKAFLSLLVLVVLLSEVYLALYLFSSYHEPQNRHLITGDLPPAVFSYHNFKPWKYTYKVKQEIAVGERVLASIEKKRPTPLIEWKPVAFGNKTSNSSDDHASSPSSTVNVVPVHAPSTTDAPVYSKRRSEASNNAQNTSLQVGAHGPSTVRTHRNHTYGKRGSTPRRSSKHLVRGSKRHFVDPHKPFGSNESNQHLDVCNTLDRTKFQSEYFCLEDVANLTQKYFKQARYGWCYVKGAELMDKRHECYCIDGWYGQHCSKPQVVEKSNYPYEYGIAVKDTPKRVIYAFPFTFEFEMLEARIEEYGDLVDVYVILESNYTAAGKAKPLYLHKNLQKGYLKNFQHKILHITMDFFPKEAYRNGWIVDETIRHYLGNQVLTRVQNVRDDDVFIIADADELPVWETVFFLKFHYGYPEPIGFNLRHNVFAFYWQGDDLTSHVFGACSIAMLRQVFQGNPYHLRSATHHMQKNPNLVNNYKYKHGGRIHEWSFGTKHSPVGWHCSWCFEAQRIQYKMISAHMSDLPRWGSNPQKTNLEYINNAIKKGLWFDDKTSMLSVNDTSERWFAPKYFMNDVRSSTNFLLKAAIYGP